MRLAVLAYVAGVLCLQWQARLPALWPWLVLAVGCALLARQWRPGRVPLVCLCAFCLGFAYAGWRAENRLAQWLPVTLEGEVLTVQGSILGLPQPSRYGPRFRLQVTEAPPGVPPLLLLNDYSRPATAWQPGQHWQLQLRLKRPHGSLNPGGSDYAAWLLGEGIGATGSVQKRGRQLLDDFQPSPSHFLHALRARLAAHIQTSLGERSYTGVMVALVVGEQGGISQAQWQLFRATGITHLVSISGLHVTLLAGLFGGLVGALWRRSSRLTLRYPARHAALLAGVLAALAYSLLAGFSVPTQRTLFMLGTAALALLSGRHLAVSTIWCAALAVVIVLDPWAVLSAGFWLSFLTVGAMLWALSGHQGRSLDWRNRLRQWGNVQWAATLGSLPLLLVLFQQLPLSSPVANALAIPAISAVVTPLALLGSVDPSGQLLLLGHSVLAATLWLIGPQGQPAALWSQAQPPAWTLLPAALAVALLLLPRGVPGRWLAALLLLPLLLPRQTPVAAGTFCATVFDVGQGLAVLVQTQQHALLFDAGPEGSGGRAVPAGLRALGVRALDVLMLSHDDGDHTGGAAALLAELPVHTLHGALPRSLLHSALPARQLPCQAGQHWVWDGVVFALLHPTQAADGEDDNARSCVLRIAGPGGSLLIPGDIGRREEADLVAAHSALDSDVLLMPHHGSHSASSPGFIAAVSPQLALASNGYQNRFRHPRPEVVARYQAAGSAVWRSDVAGAVTLRFDAQGWSAHSQAARQPRYWRPSPRDQASLMVANTRLPTPK